MHIHTVTNVNGTIGLTKLRRSILARAENGITMLELVKLVSEDRATTFPARRIAEELTKMEAEGLVRITQ